MCIAHDPGTRLRDIAARLDIAVRLDITERSAHGIITDLTAAGYLVKQRTAAATATRSRRTCRCRRLAAEPGLLIRSGDARPVAVTVPCAARTPPGTDEGSWPAGRVNTA